MKIALLSLYAFGTICGWTVYLLETPRHKLWIADAAGLLLIVTWPISISLAFLLGTAWFLWTYAWDVLENIAERD